MKKEVVAPKEKASWQAHVAFWLSLANAAFALYQWQQLQSEKPITTALEVAQKYLNDQDNAIGQEVAFKVYAKILKSDKLTDEQNDAWNHFTRSVLYVAELIEKNRVDPDYLANSIVCDIWLLEMANREMFPTRGTMVSAARRMAAGLTDRCSPFFILSGPSGAGH